MPERWVQTRRLALPRDSPRDRVVTDCSTDKMVCLELVQGQNIYPLRGYGHSHTEGSGQRPRESVLSMAQNSPTFVDP